MRPAARTPSPGPRKRRAKKAAANLTARSRTSVKGGASRSLPLSPPGPAGPVPIPYLNISGR